MNFDRAGVPSIKIKVYEDNSDPMDERLGDYISVARKHISDMHDE